MLVLLHHPVKLIWDSHGYCAAAIDSPAAVPLKTLRSTILNPISINEDKEWNRQAAVRSTCLCHSGTYDAEEPGNPIILSKNLNFRIFGPWEQENPLFQQLRKSKLGTSPRSSQVAQKSPCREIGGRWCPDFWGLYSRSHPEKDSVACLESQSARKASATARNAWTSGRLIFVLTAWGHLNV